MQISTVSAKNHTFAIISKNNYAIGVYRLHIHVYRIHMYYRAIKMQISTAIAKNHTLAIISKNNYEIGVYRLHMFAWSRNTMRIKPNF